MIHSKRSLKLFNSSHLITLSAKGIPSLVCMLFIQLQNYCIATFHQRSQMSTEILKENEMNYMQIIQSTTIIIIYIHTIIIKWKFKDFTLSWTFILSLILFWSNLYRNKDLHFLFLTGYAQKILISTVVKSLKFIRLHFSWNIFCMEYKMCNIILRLLKIWHLM